MHSVLRRVVLVGEGSQRIFATDMLELDCPLIHTDTSCSGEKDAISKQPSQQRKYDILELELDDVRLALCPSAGGSIINFTWRNVDIFRPYVGGNLPTDLSCFPLVPFCNRISDRRIQADDMDHMLPPAPQDIEQRHALHGIGWTSEWTIDESSAATASLSLEHHSIQWPWAFLAKQEIALTGSGYTHRLSLRNLDTRPMPAGLGLHPYFPRTGAKLNVSAAGFWDCGPTLIPTEHLAIDCEPDWFGGKNFDHCFTGSANPIELEWPKHRLQIHTSSNLPYTHVFVLDGEDFFCVEPVSHIPDAINNPRNAAANGLRFLEPDECLEIECRFEIRANG